MKSLRIEHKFTQSEWHKYREHFSEETIKHVLKRAGISGLRDLLAAKLYLNPYPRGFNDKPTNINDRHRTGSARSTNG